MDNLKFRIIYKCEFHQGISATETPQRINDIYGKATVQASAIHLEF